MGNLYSNHQLTKKSTVLILGATGQLGSWFLQLLIKFCNVRTSSCRIEDRQALSCEVLVIKPDIIINCAAYTKVDAAEEHWFGMRECYNVNVMGTVNIARLANMINAKLVHFSTDYVFTHAFWKVPGLQPITEEEQPTPINHYAISKWISERSALQCNPSSTLVIRTCGLYGHVVPGCEHDKSFVTAILNKLIEGQRDPQPQPIKVVNNQTCSPTYAKIVAARTIDLLKLPMARGVSGIIHITNRDAYTWFEFAEAIRTEALANKLIGNLYGHKKVPKIRAVSTHRYKQISQSYKAERPVYSVLDCTVAEKLTGELPTVKQSLIEYMLYRTGEI